eukprot:scaffold15049_cov90-Isochrysis_galbana.AAC.1
MAELQLNGFVCRAKWGMLRVFARGEKSTRGRLPGRRRKIQNKVFRRFRAAPAAAFAYFLAREKSIARSRARG